MPFTPSPLRYPGGKTKLYDYVLSLIEANGLINETYIEPFAGGAGLALKLLLNNKVKRIVINDVDYAVYCFWYSVLHFSDEMCEFVNAVPLTIEEWDLMHGILSNQEDHTILDIAKAVLYLNRTNVSGIINGGVIGGREQSGKYKMDARFNRNTLSQKIKKIAAVSSKIELYNMDAINFLQTELQHYYKVFINFDPPYVAKGGQLYTNSFTNADHAALRDAIARCKRKWIVTYDTCDLVRALYAEFNTGYIDIYYSAKDARKDKEFIFYSKNMVLPEHRD